jgi:hypothetical protein
MINRGTFAFVPVLATAILGVGCANPDADRVNPEDLKVLRAMVDIACKLDAQRIVVSDQPAIPFGSELHDTDEHNVQFGLDFDRRIARVARWPRKQICPAVSIAPEARINSALAKKSQFPGSWEAFIASFGGARTLMMISLPVYSEDGKHAVVYTTSTCPYTCGVGFYHELEKTRDGWRIDRSELAWTRP